MSIGLCNCAGTPTYGRALGAAGDVNGDGFDDVTIGVPGYTYPGFGTPGAVFVYLGGPAGLSPEPAAIIEGPWMPGFYSGFGW